MEIEQEWLAAACSSEGGARVGLVLKTRGICEGMDLDREEIPMWERSGGGEGQASLVLGLG